jgi:hypothetical protein
MKKSLILKPLLAIGFATFCAISSYGYEAELEPDTWCADLSNNTLTQNGPLPQAINVIRTVTGIGDYPDEIYVIFTLRGTDYPIYRVLSAKVEAVN